MPCMPCLQTDPSVLCLLGTVLVPVLPGSDTETVAVGTGKMRARGKTAGQTYLDYGFAGLLQHLPRPIQAQLKIILRWNTVEILLEYAFQLPTGDTQSSKIMWSIKKLDLRNSSMTA